MRRLGGGWLWAIAAVGAAASLGGCVDRTIYRDNPVFRAPPSAAAGFLGYSREADKQTVCGNCHTGQQARWETTRHADAFATLASSGEMQGFCQACHTVNQRGSAGTDSTGGFVATQDERYHDVQCENCHGPGLQHVENPDASQPIASIAVTTGPKGTGDKVGCAECHNGVHHPFVEEWRVSGHGAVPAWGTTSSTPNNRAECTGCHVAQGVLEAWGVDANYLEKGAATNPQTQLPIVCAVCHDPHGRRPGLAPTEHQLRYSISVPDEEQNLCIKCHHKRAQPDIDPITQSSRGPHSPEGPLLLGENVGFWFGDMPYDGARIVSTHGTGANPTLCARCHVDRIPVTDKLTGKFLFQATGHLFLAIPCLDPQGLPTPQTNCAVTARTFKACAGSGCHGNEDAARSAWLSAKTSIADQAAILKALVDRVRATEVKSNDGRWTTAEGADFNYQLALKKGSEVHNPFLIRALLSASIAQMKRDYGLTAARQATFTESLQQP